MPKSWKPGKEVAGAPLKNEDAPAFGVKKRKLENHTKHELNLPRQAGTGVGRSGVVIVVVEVACPVDDAEIGIWDEPRWIRRIRTQ